MSPTSVDDLRARIELKFEVSARTNVDILYRQSKKVVWSVSKKVDVMWNVINFLIIIYLNYKLADYSKKHKRLY